MKATYEEGTELVVDSETVNLTTGYTDVNSVIERQGDLVFVGLDFTAQARAAWKEKEKYALGSLVTEGGKTYKLITKEPEAEKSKPTTDAGVHWEEIAAPLTLCTLPEDFRPVAEATALKNGPTVKVKTDGTVVLGAAETGQAHAIFRAAH